MKDIVITGNIGSGKSTVTKYFKNIGYSIISADEISNKILKEYHVEIAKMFSLPPQRYLTFKKTLSNRVFSDHKVKCLLEDFMLPLIYKKIDIQKLHYKIHNIKYIIELPTLFESKGLKKYNEYYIINVIADKDIRINRVLERNKHLSIHDVLDRMRAQVYYKDSIEFSDVVIENNGTEEELFKKLEKDMK